MVRLPYSRHPDDRATRPSSFLISNAEDLTHLLIAELNGGRWLARHIGVPLVLDVTLALILLLIVPSFIHTPLSFLHYFAPDIFWLTIAVVIIPLVRDIFKGFRAWRVLRAARSVRTGFSAA